MNLSCGRESNSVYPLFIPWRSMDYRVQTAFLSMLHTVVVIKGPRHFGTWDG